MSFKLGNTTIGELYVGSNKIAQAYLGSNLVYQSAAPVDPYNPLGLPPNTFRVRTSDGNVPTKDTATRYETATLVSGTTDVYDVYESGTDLSQMFSGSNNVIEVLGANTSGVTTMERMFWYCKSLTNVALFDTSNIQYMNGMFYNCTSLTNVPLFDTSNVISMGYVFYGCTALQSVPLFDTSSVTNMSQMFYNCTSLTNVPLFDTSSVTNMSQMFRGCTNVQSGALALYQQASSQTNPPTNHSRTFYNCGKNTTTGKAELAQIPSDWK